MGDSDSNIGIVKSSYDDVNDALGDLIGNIKQGAQGNFVAQLHNSDPNQVDVDYVSVEKSSGTFWVHTKSGQYIRLQTQGDYVSTKPDNLQTAVDVLNVETATGTPWVHTVDGKFIRLQVEGNFQPAGDYVTNSELSQALSPFVKSSATDNVNDTVPLLGINKAGTPWMVNAATGNTEYLLTLSGGTMTGDITGSAGGIVPQVLGQSGRVVIQSWTRQCNNGDWIAFPSAFSSPPTTVLIQPEHYPSGQGAGASLVANYLSATLTNTGFTIDMRYINSGSSSGDNSGRLCSLFVMGVM